MVQWLRLGAFTARAWDHSLVKELRPHKPCSIATKTEREKLDSSEYIKIVKLCIEKVL